MSIHSASYRSLNATVAQLENCVFEKWVVENVLQVCLDRNVRFVNDILIVLCCAVRLLQFTL